MADPSKFGMAKRLLAHADLTGDEPPDQADLERAMAAFNELSFEERGRILGRLPSEELEADTDVIDTRLPLRAYPEADEMEAAARRVGLVRQLDALHAAVGDEGIAVGASGWIAQRGGDVATAEADT